MNYASAQSLINFDFEAKVPHLFWVSSWSRDDRFPVGFRYRIMSVRSPAMRQIDLVIVVEKSNGHSLEVMRSTVPEGGFEWVAQKLVDALGEKLALSFERQDFTTVRSSEDFNRLIDDGGRPAVTALQ